MLLYIDSIDTYTFYGVTDELVQEGNNDTMTILDTSQYYYTIDGKNLDLCKIN